MIMNGRIPSEILQVIDKDFATKYKIIPYESNEKTCRCYGVSGREYHDVITILKAIHSFEFEVTLLAQEDFNKIFISNYRTSMNVRIGSVDFLNSLISEAYLSYCSDIHFECYESRYRIRFRIDGCLIEKYCLEKTQYISLVNQVKVMASLDIAEKRLPQDGRIFYKDITSRFDVRVSVMPSIYGEKIVMRLLTRQPELLVLDNLGLTQMQLKDYKEAVSRPHGMILVSGPTGSGKSTTLYATLAMLNSVDSNIMTVEDPVEYTLDGINQVQVKEDIGMTFSSALRAFLRQDPDIIMIGEIRDEETAEIAVRSSLTGHLVLSTMHTNSALGCVSRLMEMGVSSYLQAETLNLLVSQRLIRLLCPACKKAYNYRKDLILYGKIGCPECYYTGYKGRKAIYEVIPVDSELAANIRKGEVLDEIAHKNGKTTLADAALDLLIKGQTSLEEIVPFIDLKEV